MRILTTIAGRAGSKGLPGKNIRPFCGKPLVFWSIDQALEFRRQESRYHEIDIVVNSDSTSLLSLVRGHYGDVEIETETRTKELAIDEAGKIDVLRYMADREKEYDAVIDLDITNPLRTVYDIKACLNMIDSHEVDTVVSVVPARRSPYFNQIEGMNGASRVSKIFPGKVIRRQDCPVVWDLNCCIYVYDWEWLMDESHVHPVSNNSMIYVMPDYTFCETDTLMDFQLAEHLYTKYLKG